MHGAWLKHAWRFLVVWFLVLKERPHVNQRFAVDLVAADEAAFLKAVEHGVNVCLVVRQDFGLDALRSVGQPPVAVSERPQASKQESRQRRQFAEIVIQKESMLEKS